METSPTITMSGGFRLFPLITDQRARDKDKAGPPQANDDRKPSSAPQGSTHRAQEDHDTATAPSLPKKEYKLIPEPADTEFRKEFPPDPTIGSELDDAARVWKVYRKEAKAFDDMLLDGWSDTLDILLIFAGLFSAVATAFVIESYQFLQLDNAAYAAAALYILVSASNHSTGMTLPPPPDLTYKSSLSRWINGLWFTSILLALAVALLSILAKQWITQYRARNNASAKSPKDWVLRREVYFQALNTWHVAEVVAFLPFLLHLSLFLFFAGVVAFLWTLDKAIGIWIIVLGGFLCIVYIASTLIPLWVPQCPTSTPLSMQMRMLALTLVLTGLTGIIAAPCTITQVVSSVVEHVQGLSWGRTCRHVQSRTTAFRATCTRVLSDITDRVAATAERLSSIGRYHTSNGAGTFDSTLFTRADDLSPISDNLSLFERLEKTFKRLTVVHDDKSGIRHQLEQNYHKLEADALHWLIVDVSDSDAVAVGLQSLGAFRWDSPVVDILRNHDRLVDVPDDIAFTRSSSSHTSSEVLRVIRSALCMCRRGQRVKICLRLDSSTQGNDEDYPDLGLLHASPDMLTRNVAAWREASPSLTSIALHAIRADDSDIRLAGLLYCDLARFSPVDWDLALSAAKDSCRDAVDVNLIPQFAKPFCLAVRLAGIDFWWSDHPWVDPLLRWILECVQNADFPDSYNLLPTSTLYELSSPHFLEAIPSRRIPTILGYFFYNLDRAMRDATAESLVQFWTVFARVACPVKNPDEPSVDLDLLRKLGTVLRTWQESEGIRTGVLNAILLPPQLAPSISKSIWERLRTGDQHDVHTQVVRELADALAAVLCISVRLGQNPIQTAGWNDRFFACLKRLLAPTSESVFIWGIERDRYVHLMQHCEELRPQWLDGQDMDFDDSRSAFLSQFREEAVRRGSCQVCPESLGYPPIPPRSVA